MPALLPRSPRARRRLIWVAGVLVAAGTAALVIALIPEHHGGLASSEQTGTVQLVPRPRQVRVTSETRTSIDALFDRFVPLAVARRNPAASRPLVTRELWAQATPAEWRAGTIPVPPFDPAGRTFHGWRTIYAFPRSASVELTLQPARRRDPVGSFVVNVKRIGSHWLVDGIYLEGTHGGEAEAAPKSSSEATRTTEVVGGSRGRLGMIWLLVPFGLLSLIVVIPVAVFSRQWLADARVRRRNRSQLSKELPPLPRPRDRDRISRP